MKQARGGVDGPLHLAPMFARNEPIRLAILFVVLAFAISWMCWLPVAAADHGFGTASSAGSLLVLLGTFGPFVAALAIISRTGGRRAVREFLGQAFRWRAGIQWYAAALLAPFAIRMAVIGVHVMKGGSFPDLTDASLWLTVP